MMHLLDTAELLVTSWILSGEGDRVPTSHGILDRSLQAAVNDEACPSWVRDQLHFVDSRVGLQCIELPAVLNWAQRAQLASAPNPFRQSTHLLISARAARRLLGDLDVKEEVAIKWGRLLRKNVGAESSSVGA